MKISEILSMINEERIKAIGEQYPIDKVNTKITGAFILKVFVQNALQGLPMSLRAIEQLVNENKSLSSNLKSQNEDKKRIDHSSLGKRLKTAKVDFFKEIYEDLVATYHHHFPSQDRFHIFDSTVLTISSQLLRNGLKVGGAENTTCIKMSVSLKNSIPSSVRFCDQDSEISEDVALRAAINEAKVDKEDILLFDRGIQRAETFMQFDKEDKFFITRVKVNRKHKALSVNKIDPTPDSDLRFLSDENVHLFKEQAREIKHPLRLIKVYKDSMQEEIWFLTNIKDLSADEIAAAYKQRWTIEVLFKFLKQRLQFKTFVSYDPNGMQIYLYCLLIAAILFTMYKISNNLTGYKIAMLKFMMALDKAIIKDIVLFCGGNPDLVDLRL